MTQRPTYVSLDHIYVFTIALTACCSDKRGKAYQADSLEKADEKKSSILTSRSNSGQCREAAAGIVDSVETRSKLMWNWRSEHLTDYW
ncbi:hypothetical protein E2C01_042494 [Portunus trituberculatus]|uniref:Uncharacterized protein n=1 Tax=Portunus trituberculatus TaxID=210409 RepID=A0A5B7FQD7_PORTR|nr:hypothetical protein [Portunus trituberculatus]